MSRSTAMEIFRLRLDCVDHYQARPTAFDPALFGRGGPDGPRVPVIRVFGSTTTGQKVCAHVHGALPYLYVEYDGGAEAGQVDGYVQRLHLSIDHALAGSYRRNPYEGGSNFVGRISLVKAVPFYGYHVGHRLFLKIYLLDPQHMGRLADLLRQGAVLSRVFQPYESHLQYLLQWMCDFNLYGCGWVDCRAVSFRRPVPAQAELDDAAHLWHDGSIGPGSLSSELPRQSHCALEVDVRVQDILNRLQAKERPLHHDFGEVDAAVGDEKLVFSMAGLWRDESRRRKAAMGLADPGSSSGGGGSDASAFPPEALVSMSAEARAPDPAGWMHEAEYREQMRGLIEEERRQLGGQAPTFANMAEPEPALAVPTAFQSVEDLFVRKADAFKDEVADDDDVEAEADVDLDEAMASSVVDDFPDESDDEVARQLETDGRPETTRARDDGVGEPWRDVPSLAPLLAAELDGLGPEDFNYGESSPEAEHASAAKVQAAYTTPSPSDRAQKKRRVVRPSSSPADEHGPMQPPPGNPQHEALLRNEPAGRRPAKPGKPGKLSFAVVKDPHDPDTRLRLSQRSDSDLSSSWDKSGAGKASAKTESPSQSSSAQVSGDGSFDDGLTASLEQMACSYCDAFEMASTHQLLFFAQPPPSAATLEPFSSLHLPTVIYPEAHYGDEEDVPARARHYAGRDFRLLGTTLPFLPDFDPSGRVGRRGTAKDGLDDQRRWREARRKCRLRSWEMASVPPSRAEVEAWWSRRSGGGAHEGGAVQEPGARPTVGSGRFDDGATQTQEKSKYGGAGGKASGVRREARYMSLLSVEVHVNTRQDLLPDPEHDAVACIFWSLQAEDEAGLATNARLADHPATRTGIIVVVEPDDGGVRLARQMSRLTRLPVEAERSELDALMGLVELVRGHDPDILTGWEVHDGSWGYLIDRARRRFDLDLCAELSRVRSPVQRRPTGDGNGSGSGNGKPSDDRWGYTRTSTVRVTGRHTINIWRAMRSELNLLQYSQENVVFQLLQRRIPHYSARQRTAWYVGGGGAGSRGLGRVLAYYLARVQLNLAILDRNELVARTSEQARLLGVDFYSVFSRGSQFKVESLMFRIAKAENLLLVSPSRAQVGRQNALECLPLVMEPQSDFYRAPVLVLDFRSLYPSIMIAYNYCYSTLLGRIEPGGGKMGFDERRRRPGLVELLGRRVNVAPNGIMYAAASVRRSLLARMLAEILETRVMVRSGMAAAETKGPEAAALQRLLNHRQLALKLIANVTYGYTSASFSGRMPCAEMADSIVQTARETLEKAIALIHATARWRAEVVYGDTDSLFVSLPGRSRAEAFAVGQEMAAAVTAQNPRPIKLKFEKVYQPCVLLAKKRYVGFAYERADQAEPVFDAKGIETVRRDGTPAAQQMEEAALKLLFRTADLSRVKAYVQRRWRRLLAGQLSLQDFCFAREVKLGSYRDDGAGPPPPGALISARRMAHDGRAEPQYGERVPYVVRAGAPGARLIDRCVAPDQLLADPHGRLDAEYYISKHLIPPLERIFNLVGANVRAWYDEMPRLQRVQPAQAGARAVAGMKTLEAYMTSTACVVCRQSIGGAGRRPAGPAGSTRLCAACRRHSARAMATLQGRLRRAEQQCIAVDRHCRSCAGMPWPGAGVVSVGAEAVDEVACDSLDCPVYYRRRRLAARAALDVEVVQPALDELRAVASQREYEW